MILREDNVKRGSWPLGRIEQAHPGQDVIVHVNVCTKTEVYVIPFVKIYMLEECYVDKIPEGGGMLQKLPQIVGAERELS